MPLRPCPSCSCHVDATASVCPHCDASLSGTSPQGTSGAFRLPAAALLMGLALTGGCGQSVAIYGVAITDPGPFVDADEDGYIEGTAEGEDCDDSDPEINPDAEETPGDAVDSNCDGEDDT